MGQYYKPTIIYQDGSIASLYSHAYNSGLKLTEHSWIGNDFVNAVYSRILNKPRRIAWIGDYSDDDYETCGEAYTKHFGLEDFMSCYSHAWGDEDENENIPPSMYTQEDLDLINEKTKGMYLVNHDLKEYLDLGDYIERCTVKEGNWKGYCVNPLPLLTACGNGRGRGDFHSNDTNIGPELVGIWAFDELELTSAIPDSYHECAYSFVEGN